MLPEYLPLHGTADCNRNQRIIHLFASPFLLIMCLYVKYYPPEKRESKDRFKINVR